MTPELRGKTNKKSLFFLNWKNVIQKRKKREKIESRLLKKGGPHFLAFFQF